MLYFLLIKLRRRRRNKKRNNVDLAIFVIIPKLVMLTTHSLRAFRINMSVIRYFNNVDNSNFIFLLISSNLVYQCFPLLNKSALL